MALSLHTLKPAKGSRRTSKRVGRGLGSKGTYSGRGVKGQGARSGVSGLRLRGLRKIMLSQPKLRGFKSIRPRPATVTLEVLARVFENGTRVTPGMLVKKGIIDTVPPAGVKILGTGTIGIKLTIVGMRVTEGAKTKLEQAGGGVA